MNAPIYCSYHIQRPAWSFCAHCGAPICQECQTLDPNGQALCPLCLAERSPILVETHPEPKSQEPTTWLEVMGSLKDILFHPTQFFLNMIPKQGVVKAMGFGVFWSSLSIWSSLGLYTLFFNEDSPIIRGFRHQNEFLKTQWSMDPNLPIDELIHLQLTTLPLMSLLQILIYGLFFHLLARMWHKKQWPLSTALKITAYALGAQVFLILPFPTLAAISARFFSITILMVGFRIVYEMSFVQAALTVIIPSILFGGLGYENLIFSIL